MRFLALASDYDGTLARDGRVSPATLDAIARFRRSGRRLVLVTGRKLDDLRRVFPEYEVCDRIVAENGALLFSPETREERLLTHAPPAKLLTTLRSRRIACDAGRAIVASSEHDAHAILSVIQELGLELQLIFNKGSVMILPTGVNKATGLLAALTDLGLSPHNTVGVGDAENDHALLEQSEFGVAMCDSVDTLKERADWVTRGDAGEGVVELIEELLTNDLAKRASEVTRHDLVLGDLVTGRARGEKVTLALPPHGQSGLICGTSGSGKSTLATGFLEQLEQQGYQYCLVDPEGDFDALPGAIVLGDEHDAEAPEQVIELLEKDPARSVVANLLAVPLERRPQHFLHLMALLLQLRMRVGRPHWLVVDEAHHMLPEGGLLELPDLVKKPPSGLVLITVHPSKVSRGVLAHLDAVVALGTQPLAAVREFAQAVSCQVPEITDPQLGAGEALFWRRSEPERVERFVSRAPRSERHRHRRKYAAGELGADKSFYFRGPDGQLNLRAQNLRIFLQIADGVDERTFLHHLKQHDYSTWMRDAIKNEELAQEVSEIERGLDMEPRKARERLREVVERAYTLPA